MNAEYSVHSMAKTIIPGLLSHNEACSQKKSASSLAMSPDKQDELGVTGLKPASMAVTAASFVPASPLGWPSWGAAGIYRHRHCLQTTAFVPMGVVRMETR